MQLHPRIAHSSRCVAGAGASLHRPFPAPPTAAAHHHYRRRFTGMPEGASQPVDQRNGPLSPVLPPPPPEVEVLNPATNRLDHAAGLTAYAPASKQGSVEPYTTVIGPDAWYAKDFTPASAGGPLEYVHQLSADEVAELDAAVHRLEGSSLVTVDGNNLKLARPLTPEEFPLPTLSKVLLDIRQEVHWGRGFALLRGISVERYSRLQALLAYWGLGLYWGNPVRQNKKGHLIGHVKDLGFDSNHQNPTTRIYMTRVAQPWHNDAADLVALLCLQQAKSGGLSRWASSITIYNEVLRQRPDLVPVMAGSWYMDRKDEIPEGKAPFFILPVAHYYKGYLSLNYDDTYYRLAAARHKEVPPLTPQQLEVIQLINSIASRPDVQLTWNLQPGDLQLLNNHTTFHTRDAWEDHEDPALKRHLLRLWLAPPDGRPLPPQYAEVWHSVTPGARGGIVVEGGEDLIPLEAEKGN